MARNRYARKPLANPGYRPRAQMPLFTFLAVVTPGLLALLLLAPCALDPIPPRKDVMTPARALREVAPPTRLPQGQRTPLPRRHDGSARYAERAGVGLFQ
jgi:hypothetical protein